MDKPMRAPAVGTDASRRANGPAIALAKLSRADVVAITVTPNCRLLPFGAQRLERTPDAFESAGRLLAHRPLLQLRQPAGGAGVPCMREVDAFDRLYEAIGDTARANHCDLTTVASDGHRGVERRLLAGATVPTYCDISVLVHR